MIESYVRNPVKVTVGVLLVALFGVIGLLRMPMQLTPEVEIPTITITTAWPGASPGEVERQIIIEQEEQLKSVEGLVKMTSESNDSSGTVILEFPVGTDMGEALLRVNTRLQQVERYPEDAREPVITSANSGDRPIGWFILRPLVVGPDEIAAFRAKHEKFAEELELARTARNSGLRLKRIEELVAAHPGASELRALLPRDIDITTYRKFAEDFIEARFERVPGVANANVLGGREMEMQVVVDPERLAARRLTITDVRDALQGANQNTSAGDFYEGKRRPVVRTLGQFESAAEILEVVVAYEDGRPVYVRDIAAVAPDGEPVVRIGYKKPDGIVKQFGHTSIAINAQRAVGANVLDVMAGLRKEVETLNEKILKPRGLQLEQVYDETDYIYSSIDLVNRNIIIGGCLTLCVLLAFLRSARSTLVIAVAIPASVVGTFLVMSLLGRSLNVVSLAGIAFAVGMLVDNAVVVLENIFSHYQAGKPPFRAAVEGAKEVQGAVLSSTLTTLAVFLPVLFIEEQAGQLFRDIALAVSAGVGLSLVVSLTVIPMASARLLPSRRPAAGQEPSRLAGLLKPVDWVGGRVAGAMMAVNRGLARSAAARLVAVAGFLAGAAGLTWLLWPKVEYLPNGNQNLVFGILLPPPGYNLDELLQIGEQVEGGLRPYWDVEPGSPEADELRYPPLKDFFYVARGRQVFMGVKTTEPNRAGEMVPMLGELYTDIPGTFGIPKQSSLFERGLTAGRTVDIEITGPDIDKLLALGRRVIGRVGQTIPGARAFPQPSLDKASPELHLKLRRERAAEMGVTDREFGYWMDALIDGAYAGDYYKGNTKIDLTIIGAGDYARLSQDVAALPVAVPGGAGRPVTVTSVADVIPSSGPEQIRHANRLRTITIQVTPPEDVPLEEAMEAIEGRIVGPIRDEGQLGEEYQINLAGTVDKLRSTWSALRLNFLLAVVITYLLMAALFESWVYPLVVIVSVPFGALGGLMGLAALNLDVNQPLDVLTMLGFVMLIGTVVNNPILIVQQALNLTRAGVPCDEAILEATRSRVRPIFMTTLTTVLGLVPLVLLRGAGSELYRGLGAVLLGGLMFSTLVTLVLVPSVFTMLMNTQDWVIRKCGGDVGDAGLPVAEEVPA